jgi:hypothetical protein
LVVDKRSTGTTKNKGGDTTGSSTTTTHTNENDTTPTTSPPNHITNDTDEDDDNEEEEDEDNLEDETPEVDPFLLAVGGTDKLVTGEAYRAKLLAAQQQPQQST